MILIIKRITTKSFCLSNFFEFSNEMSLLEPISIYFITVPSFEKAEQLSQILLEKKLVACCNLIGSNENMITSMYTWKGNIEKEKEILMICKSRVSLLNEIVDEVKKNHEYTVPEIIASPIIGGNEDYLKWVIENTKFPNEKI